MVKLQLETLIVKLQEQFGESWIACKETARAAVNKLVPGHKAVKQLLNCYTCDQGGTQPKIQVLTHFRSEQEWRRRLVGSLDAYELVVSLADWSPLVGLNTFPVLTSVHAQRCTDFDTVNPCTPHSRI